MIKVENLKAGHYYLFEYEPDGALGGLAIMFVTFVDDSPDGWSVEGNALSFYGSNRNRWCKKLSYRQDFLLSEEEVNMYKILL